MDKIVLEYFMISEIVNSPINDCKIMTEPNVQYKKKEKKEQTN